MKVLDTVRAVLVVGGFLSAGSPVQAREAAPMHTVEGLGTIAFPTSTQSAAAQDAFVRGALLLHLFEYPDASKAFREAERLDPAFAMAYWGEAMSHNHGIWNEVDQEAGRAALARLGATPAARAEKAPTQREKDYLAAVEILYADTGTKKERDARYEQAMERMASAYPDDANAQLFHSLALMGRSEGVRDVPTYLRAGLIAERIFKANPKDPGAAHYWIHSMDDPEHATAALVPARALSNVAPEAAHARHMTSHIFMALGMWDDVVAANEAAVRVVNAARKRESRPAVACGHYLEWLEYAFYQQGRRNDAGRMLQACQQSIQPAIAWADGHAAQLAATQSTPAMVGQGLNESLIQMRGIAVVESNDGAGPAGSMHVDTAGTGPNAGWNDFIDGYAAVQRGDLPAAQASLAAVAKLRAARTADEAAQTSSYLAILEDELRGLLQIEQGNVDGGLDALRRAATRYENVPFDFGPPVTFKPPHELLGEQLLAHGDTSAARKAFDAALEHAPRRTASLLGRARAEAAGGDIAAAIATYRALIGIWHAADPDLSELGEARRFVAAHAKASDTR